MLRKMIMCVGSFLIIVLIGILIPLLGWGLDDVSGFFNNSARLIYVVIVVIQAVIIAVRFGGSSDNPLQRQGQAEKFNRQQILVPVLNRILMITLYFLAPYCARRGILLLSDAAWLPYFGLVVYLGGVGLTYWAHLILGKQHSVQVTIQDDHQLITDGPYKWVRHPIYLGTTLTPLGFALLFVSSLGLGITAVILALFLWRIHDEERLLRHEFGKEWEAYYQHSWRLLPYTY